MDPKDQNAFLTPLMPKSFNYSSRYQSLKFRKNSINKPFRKLQKTHCEINHCDLDNGLIWALKTVKISILNGIVRNVSFTLNGRASHIRLLQYYELFCKSQCWIF